MPVLSLLFWRLSSVWPLLVRATAPDKSLVIIDGEKHTLWIVVDGDGLTIIYPEDY
jgi:hypothetical protein